MRLTDRFNDELLYNGVKLKLSFSFDNVLRGYELLNDNLFNSIEKVHILCDMFVTNHDEIELSLEDKNKIVKYIFENYLNDNSENGSVPSSGGKRYLDITQDSRYIYASFMQDYNIDLFEMQGKLHWYKFLALLDGLSDKTKLKEVISIRQQEIPKPDKYNAKERQRIINLKRVYRLDGDNVSLQSADNAMSAYSESLKRASKRN
ncbi:MAG TPA: Gp15 family bacteriophage protein [Rummeliibacillus sp.]|nr:Gp15 family bacteriophage protein [Rummeliibacillus sp.]